MRARNTRVASIHPFRARDLDVTLVFVRVAVLELIASDLTGEKVFPCARSKHSRCIDSRDLDVKLVCVRVAVLELIAPDLTNSRT